MQVTSRLELIRLTMVYWEGCSVSLQTLSRPGPQSQPSMRTLSVRLDSYLGKRKMKGQFENWKDFSFSPLRGNGNGAIRPDLQKTASRVEVHHDRSLLECLAGPREWWKLECFYVRECLVEAAIYWFAHSEEVQSLPLPMSKELFTAGLRKVSGTYSLSLQACPSLGQLIPGWNRQSRAQHRINTPPNPFKIHTCKFSIYAIRIIVTL